MALNYLYEMIFLSYFNDPQAGEYFNYKTLPNPDAVDVVPRNLLTFHP